MKRRFLATLLALTMVAGLFCGMQKESKADYPRFECITEDNLDTVDLEYPEGMTARQYIKDGLERENPWLPGDLVMPGDDVMPGLHILFMDKPLTISLPMNTWCYDGLSDAVASLQEQVNAYFREEAYHQSYGPDGLGFITKAIELPEGYDAWKVQAYCSHAGMSCCLYPVKLTPAAPEYRDCKLTVTGNTTTWTDHAGKVVWNITETEDAINADLSNWASLPASTIEAWKASGKAINLSYSFEGQDINLNIPGGALVVTGDEWYGGARIKDLNGMYYTLPQPSFDLKSPEAPRLELSDPAAGGIILRH